MDIDIGFSESQPRDKKGWAEFVDVVNSILDKYWGIAVGIFGICTLVLAGILIYRFARLSTTAGDPPARKKAISGIIFTVVAVALMGGLTVYIGLVYNFFR